MTVQILVGDCRQTLAHLAAQTFHTCVTSPPYFGLRDYGTPPLYWPAMEYSPMPGMPPCVEVPSMTCSLGLEPTLEAFIGHQLQVFRCVRRVLRDDGTLWVNMGDSYAGSRRGGFTGQSSTLSGKQPDHSRAVRQARRHQVFTEDHKDASLAGLRAMTASRRRDNEPIPRSDLAIPGLKAKDLVGVPWRLAFALQADGWYLRQDIVWHKPNPMPESVTDRCTKAHEYIFLLSKSERYYFDHAAIREQAIEPEGPGNVRPNPAVPGHETGSENGHTRGRLHKIGPRETRSKRSVWTVTTEGFPGAHFATFPTKLVEPCILAGCPPGGNALDCFGGSGTVGVVADRLQRNAVLCELNPGYAQMADDRVHGDAPLFAEVDQQHASPEQDNNDRPQQADRATP